MMTIEQQKEAIKKAGQEALRLAVVAWNKGIMDPTRKAWGDPSFDDDRAFINLCIKSPSQGLGWPSVSMTTKDYRWDGDFEWCGAFASHAWQALDPDIRKHYLASTYRLFRYARYQSPPNKFVSYMKKAPEGTVERKFAELLGNDAAKIALVEKFEPQMGDILIVNGTDRFGQHITVVDSWDPVAKTFDTVEGNATGRGPKGQRFQGVIRQTRPIAVCKHLYRPGFADIMRWPE
jgi:hypothetical protein